MQGCGDTLLMSAGSNLLMHKPWVENPSGRDGVDFSPYSTPTYLPTVRDLHSTSSTVSTLAGPPDYPEQFVVMNDYVIFSNGMDRAIIVTAEGTAFPLGYVDVPSTPSAEGPKGVDIVGRNYHYPNSHGYSWEGNIGTVGDMLSSDGGGILAGHFIYHVQYEDQFGNFSATSPPSNSVRVEPHSADPIRGGMEEIAGILKALDKTLGVEIKDVQRQFLLRCFLPEHKASDSHAESWQRLGVSVRDSVFSNCTVAVNIYRTPDIDNVGPSPRFVARIPAAGSFSFPDNTSDADLGDDMVRTVSVPAFKVMCTHQGRLIIGNISGAPGMVMRSERGFPGTFSAIDFVFPDSSGEEITALCSHGGRLYAFTETTVYSMDDFSAPIPISTSVGCVAPKSIQPMRNGALVWLGRNGFYSMQGNQINHVSSAINRTFKTGLNKSRFRSAVSVIDPDSGEYRCAVCPAGSSAQTLILCFDGDFWREISYNMHISDFAVTRDSRDLCLMYACDEDVAQLKQNKLNQAALKSVGTGLGYAAQPSGGDVTHQNAEGFYRRGPSIYVMNRETAASGNYGGLTGNGCGFSHKAVYRSGWLRADQNSLTPVNVRTMFIGLVDTESTPFIVRFFKNGSTKPVSEMTVSAIGVDDETGIAADVGDLAVLGEAKAQRPRLFWRQIPANLSTANTWCFEIETTVDGNGGQVEIASFAFDMSIATRGNPRSRIPGREDV